MISQNKNPKSKIINKELTRNELKKQIKEQI